jgi:cellulose biosynthesis protein BcsQ
MIHLFKFKHFSKMKKQTLFVAFSTQKGGMGKTAVTVLTASYLHYIKGYHVVVVDCDFPQLSIFHERLRDGELIVRDGYFKRTAYDMFRSLGIKAYPVKDSTPEKAVGDAQALMENSQKEFDVIFGVSPDYRSYYVGFRVVFYP